jgi:TonB family protein
VFCQNCGKKQDDVVASSLQDPFTNACPHCGEIMGEGDLFCQNCGKSNHESGMVNTPINNEDYSKYNDSSKNNVIIPIAIVIGCILILALLCGGWWYYSSYKPKLVDNVSVQNDSVAVNESIIEDAVEDTEEIGNSIVEDTVSVDYSLPEETDVKVDDNFEDEELVKEALSQYDDYIANKQTEEKKVFDVVEQMPSYPGGDEALMRYISNNLQYPVVAEENGIQGRVIVSFVVERDGSITEVNVVKSVDPSLDKEAVRVLKSMPRWEAGIQDGKPVRVKYTVPVTFRLQ